MSCRCRYRTDHIHVTYPKNGGFVSLFFWILIIIAIKIASSPKPSLSMMALNSPEVPVYSRFYLPCNLVPDQKKTRATQWVFYFLTEEQGRKKHMHLKKKVFGISKQLIISTYYWKSLRTWSCNTKLFFRFNDFWLCWFNIHLLISLYWNLLLNQ